MWLQASHVNTPLQTPLHFYLIKVEPTRKFPLFASFSCSLRDKASFCEHVKSSAYSSVSGSQLLGSVASEKTPGLEGRLISSSWKMPRSIARRRAQPASSASSSIGLRSSEGDGSSRASPSSLLQATFIWSSGIICCLTTCCLYRSLSKGSAWFLLPLPLHDWLSSWQASAEVTWRPSLLTTLRRREKAEMKKWNDLTVPRRSTVL